MNPSPFISAHSRRLARRLTRAGTILEMLIAVVIFLVGIVAILHFFPMSMRTNEDAADLGIAAMLAQWKAEEIRRDNDQQSNLMNAIRTLTQPTAPLAFPSEPRMAYSFCGLSLIDPNDSPGTPRVIVRYAQSFRPSQDILFELKFQE